jgi:predicted DNA-binding transcriptional regulator YafY
VIEQQQVRLEYVDRQRHHSARVVHPLGLATKGQTWYLVADTEKGLRTFRVDRVASIERTGERAVRPDGFVLAEAWKLIADEVDQRRNSVWAQATVERSLLWLLRSMFGTRVRIGGSRDDGTVEVELGSNHARGLAGEIAGLGSALRVSGPPEVIAELARIGSELAETYGAPAAPAASG